MGIKAKVRNSILGWLPKEPTLPTQHKPLLHFPYIGRWLAMGILGGLGAAGLLVVFGELTGINSGYGAVLWFIEVASLAWCVGGFISVYGYLRKKSAEGKIDENN